MLKRPFRAPHQTISMTALAGGGRNPKPGEITLANLGVLFLDELPEFKREVLETLRQPLEDGEILINRLKGAYRFPARFMFSAAMNPCSCGYYPDESRCTCSAVDVQRHYRRISRPLLDRIDLMVEVLDISCEELQKREAGESSAEIRKRVERARRIQAKRYQNTEIRYNSQLRDSSVQQFCILREKEQQYLNQIFRTRTYSARAYHKILKIARTIADLQGEAEIQCGHLNEAMCYRNIDEKYWGNDI